MIGRLGLALCALLLAAIIMALMGCAPVLIRRATAIPHFAAEYRPTPGDDMRPALLDLMARLEAWGVTIEDMPADAIAGWGRAHLHERRIQLNPTLSINGRFEVLAHEAGHFFQPVALESNAVSQMFAESVGVGVQRHYGSKTAIDVGATYLAGLKEGFPAEPYLRRDIDYAIRALTGQVPFPQWREPR